MTSPAPTRAAIYARVSTFDQQPENQLTELRDYVQARGSSAHEYTDKGISGAKDNRPALDQLGRDAKHRKFDVLICWRLDRLGRSLKHLVTLLDELQVLGIAFVSLAEGIEPPRQRASCRCTSWLPSRSLNGLELPRELPLAWPEPASKAPSSVGPSGSSLKPSSDPYAAFPCEKRLGGCGSRQPQPTAGCSRKSR